MPESGDLSLAIIGAGSIGTRHLSNLEFIGGNRVVAVCDADDTQASKMANRIGAHTYLSVNAMFDAEPGIDAVLICVPPRIRQQVFERAAERGIAVFCEKPPADSMEHAQEIARIVGDSGILCMVGFHQRYLPPVDRLRELLVGRTINVLLSSYLTSPALTGRLRPWLFNKEQSGGPLMDDAIHFIDLMRYIAGEIESVHTLGNNVARPKGPGFTIEDTFISTIRFASGASGHHVHSWATPWGTSGFAVNGPDFHLNLRLSGPPSVYGTIGDPNGDGTPVRDEFTQTAGGSRGSKMAATRSPDDPPDPMHHREMVVFLNAVRTGNTSAIRSSYADGMRSLATVLAMNQSVASGQVEVPDL